MTDTRYQQADSQRDKEALLALWRQAFLISPAYWERYLERIGWEHVRVLRNEAARDGSGRGLEAALAMYRLAQWFGGRELPMVGVAAVAVAPETRGRGLASKLLAHTLTEIADAGVPLSVLYPATHELYRRGGYGLGGHRAVHSLPLASLPMTRGEVELRRVHGPDSKEVRELARRRAALASGVVTRDRALWERLFESRAGEGVYTVVAGPEGAPSGYAIFDLAAGETSTCTVRDLVAFDPHTAKSLFAMLARHRTTVTDARLVAPARGGWLEMLPEPKFKTFNCQPWFLRLVDVERALALRGYPNGLAAELHFAVRDGVLARNDGRFVLRVASSGEARVERGGRGEIGIAVDGLATLYTGAYTAQQLATFGKLTGPDPALATATALFAGPEPWMPDFF
jgi:predicted acetyltransferase